MQWSKVVLRADLMEKQFSQGLFTLFFQVRKELKLALLAFIGKGALMLIHNSMLE